MAANNRASVRPAGRSPPFLAIGLTVALIILGFNYWSLSARNSEQADEIAVLESETRLSNAKKLAAEKREETMADKIKDLENELSNQKAVVADKMAQLSNLGSEKENLLNEKQKCDSDYLSCRDELLPACMKEKDELLQELEKAKEDLQNEKNRPQETCDESKCSAFGDASREKLLEELYNYLGSGPLVALHQKGVNVGKYETEISRMAAQTQNQQPQHPFVNGLQPFNPAAQPIVKAGQDLPNQQQQPNPDQQQQQQQGDQQQQPPQDQQQQPQPDQQQQPGYDQAKALEQQQNVVDQQQPQGAVPAEPQLADQGLPQVPGPNDGRLGEAFPPAENQQVDENDRIKADDDGWKRNDIILNRDKNEKKVVKKESNSTNSSTAVQGTSPALDSKLVNSNEAINMSVAGDAGNQAQSSPVEGNQLTSASTAPQVMMDTASRNNISQLTSQNVSKHMDMAKEVNDDEKGLEDDYDERQDRGLGAADADANDDDFDDDDDAAADDAGQDDDVLRVPQNNPNLGDDYDGDDDYDGYRDAALDGDDADDDNDGDPRLNDLERQDSVVDEMKERLEDAAPR